MSGINSGDVVATKKRASNIRRANQKLIAEGTRTVTDENGAVTQVLVTATAGRGHHRKTLTVDLTSLTKEQRLERFILMREGLKLEAEKSRIAEDQRIVADASSCERYRNLYKSQIEAQVPLMVTDAVNTLTHNVLPTNINVAQDQSTAFAPMLGRCHVLANMRQQQQHGPQELQYGQHGQQHGPQELQHGQQEQQHGQQEQQQAQQEQQQVQQGVQPTQVQQGVQPTQVQQGVQPTQAQQNTTLQSLD